MNLQYFLQKPLHIFQWILNLRVVARLLAIFLEGQSTLKSLHKIAIVPEWERLAVCTKSAATLLNKKVQIFHW